MIVWDGTQYGVAWIEPGEHPGVAVARVSPAGEPTGDVVRVAEGMPGPDLSLAWNGTEYGIVWARVVDGMGFNLELRLARVSREGARLADSVVITGPVRSPILCWTGSEYVIAYSLGPAPNRGMKLARLEGQTWTAADVAADAADTDLSPAGLACGEGRIFFGASSVTMGIRSLTLKRYDSLGRPQGAEIPLGGGLLADAALSLGPRGLAAAVTATASDGAQTLALWRVTAAGRINPGGAAVAVGAPDMLPTFPRVAIAGDEEAVVWIDVPPGSSATTADPTRDVWFARVRGSTVLPGRGGRRITNGTASSVSATVACDGPSCVVAWDARGRNRGVFVARVAP